jgi:hypothetical protein
MKGSIATIVFVLWSVCSAVAQDATSSPQIVVEQIIYDYAMRIAALTQQNQQDQVAIKQLQERLSEKLGAVSTLEKP